MFWHIHFVIKLMCFDINFVIMLMCFDIYFVIKLMCFDILILIVLICVCDKCVELSCTVIEIYLNVMMEEQAYP
jgi:hypothetical protein